jgi:hypothetical protein
MRKRTSTGINDWPTWDGQQTGARWTDSLEYLEAWEQLPSRWALPVPQAGGDPADSAYHHQPTAFADLVPAPARQTFSPDYLVLLDRLAGTEAADRSRLEGRPTILLTTWDSRPGDWEWADEGAPSRAAWMMVQAAKWATIQPLRARIEAVARPWERPLLIRTLAPVGWIAPLELTEPTRRMLWRLADLGAPRPSGTALDQAMTRLEPAHMRVTATNWSALTSG